MTPEAIQAAERLLAVFTDPYEASLIAPHLTRNQVDALANFMAEMGEPETAVQWLMFQERA